MNAVGKLGSFFSRSVNTVSGPFHPFGGAVDIIVVEQQDGSFKSSPWYVRFGKFQGVLKTKEKVVSINVNGVDADFNMYLDHKGEAYFLREVEVEQGDSLFSPSSSEEDTDGQSRNRRPVKSKSWNYDANYSDSVTQIGVSNGNIVARTNSKRSRILGFVFGRKSIKGNNLSEKENGTGVVRAESLERAEIAADLLEVKWSTNFASNRCKKDNALQSSAEDASTDDTNKDLKEHDGQSNEGSGMNQNIADNLDGNKTHEEASSAGPGKNHNPPSSFEKLENSVEETGTKISCLVSEYLVETVTVIGSTNESVLDKSVKTEEFGVVSADNVENAVNTIPEIAIPNLQASDSIELQSRPGNMIKREHFNVQDILVEKNHIIIAGNKGLESENTSPNSIRDNSVSRSSSQVVTFQSPNRFHERVESRSVSTICSASDMISEVEQGISVRKEVGDTQRPGGESALLNILGSEISEEEQLLFGDLDEFALSEVKNLELVSHKEEEADLLLSLTENEGDESALPKYETSSSPDDSPLEDMHSYANDGRRKLKTTSRDVHFGINNKGQPKEVTRMVRSLPNMWSLDNRIANDLGHSVDCYLDSSCERSKKLFLPPDFISCVKSGADGDGQSTLAEQTTQDSKTIHELEDRQTNAQGGDPSKSMDASTKGSIKVSEPAPNSNGSSDTENIIKSPRSKDEQDVPKNNVVTKTIITLTPTSEQLSTLNLKEGRNTVTFTFSTSMLGKQQVDARIYLWRWDTRIVISDVDGTITRSDVLGQFMPFVGVDWSHSGVAHLFSAIKENGYQFIFLSARAVSQAYHTRQFLFNLKQDGKSLPDGPVVLSPDGIFPSLIREVVIRAPHKFKIACLKEIKALFPSDRNPFYAGFGNRETDEFSYLKVGIPKGKIFTINPKGEIVVNRHIDTKSYTSLHALVNDIFPPTPLSEEVEDFNTWNYWKLPPPVINM